MRRQWCSARIARRTSACAERRRRHSGEGAPVKRARTTILYSLAALATLASLLGTAGSARAWENPLAHVRADSTETKEATDATTVADGSAVHAAALPNTNQGGDAVVEVDGGGNVGGDGKGGNASGGDSVGGTGQAGSAGAKDVKGGLTKGGNASARTGSQGQTIQGDRGTDGHIGLDGTNGEDAEGATGGTGSTVL